MKLSLVVSQGKPEGREIPVRLSQFLIGRDPECHLRPGSPLVSKRHCAVIVRNNKVFLRDFDSTNGTIVNGKPLKGEIELKDGDQITVGPLGFRVKIVAGTPETPKPAPALPTVENQPATPATPPKAPARKPVAAEAKGGGDNLDEDSVMEMLLNLEGEPSGGPGITAGNDPIPPGSTIMQIVGAGQEEGTPPDQEGDKKQPDKKAKEKAKPPVDPQTAAKAILEKYMRRPRSS